MPLHGEHLLSCSSSGSTGSRDGFSFYVRFCRTGPTGPTTSLLVSVHFAWGLRDQEQVFFVFQLSQSLATASLATAVAVVLLIA